MIEKSENESEDEDLGTMELYLLLISGGMR